MVNNVYKVQYGKNVVLEALALELACGSRRRPGSDDQGQKANKQTVHGGFSRDKDR